MKRSKHPSRWSFKHGAWYYQVPMGQRDKWDGKAWFRLGKTDSEAYRTWYQRLGEDADAEGSGLSTMNGVWDSWWKEYVLVRLAESTQDAYGHYLKPLRMVFGRMHPGAIKPHMAYKYMAKRPNASANRELSVLIKGLSHAVRKGVIDRNLLKGQMERNSEPPRDRLPTQAEINDFLQTAPAFLRGYVALKRISGARQSQLLEIWLPRQWKDSVLLVERAKGGRDVEYEGECLEAVVDYILYQRWGNNVRPLGHLFTTRKGTRMTNSAFKSMWRRAMAKYVKQGGVAFHEHDVRAVVATKAKTLEHAAALLGHQDPKTTARVYRRGPQRVQVLES